ncbi:helix-turn-helix domain-containing protein [Agrobacterium tumefaciens]|nr:helix-turn-helix domain-containing protein [Agrobacterium tumefaciens]WCK72420.1 helix-turn-helix domain-containing protein [Agrobacterium tumefaciens]
MRSGKDRAHHGRPAKIISGAAYAGWIRLHRRLTAKTLVATPQAARRIVLELGLREMTGRGRFRAWGVI